MKLMQDDKGNQSAGRFMSFVCLAVAIIQSFMLINKDGGIQYNELWLVGMWLLAGVATKSVGKFVEKMEPPKQ